MKLGKKQRVRSFLKGAAALGLGLAILGSDSAQAVDARVLPKGRSRFAFIVGQTAGISQVFNDRGEKQNITKPYNLSLNSGQLTALSTEITTAINVLNGTGYRYDKKTNTVIASTDPNLPLIGDAMSKGDLGVDVEANRTVYNVAYQYGITDRIGVGFLVPIIHTTVRTRYGIEEKNATTNAIAAATAGQFGGNAGIQNALQIIQNGVGSINAANSGTLQTMLESAGYQRFGDYEGSGIGDVVFGGRYNYMKTRKEETILSSQLGFTAPTGRTRPPSALTEVDNGQGCWDFNLAHIANYAPRKTKFMFSNSLNYTHRLPGTRRMRVRKDAGDFLPDASTEEPISMNLGDKFWAQWGTKYNVSKTFNVELNYEFYWKAKDHYQGSRQKDYTYLSDATSLYLETFNIAANLSSIDSFLNYKFPVPGDFSVNYYLPTNGRNAVIAPYATFELALYF